MKNCAYKKHPFGKWACDFMSKKELEKYAKRKNRQHDRKMCREWVKVK